MPAQNISDALYLPGPFPISRFDLSIASLTVNGGLNLLNSVGNAAVNSVGLILQPFDAYAGELITLESAFPGGVIAAGPTLLAGGISRSIRSAAAANAITKAEVPLLTSGSRVPNAGGKIISFVTERQQTFYRVFSGDRTVGSFLTAVKPGSSAFAREALALPPGNTAAFVQEVIVPAGTRLQRSRALPAFGRRGGAEQFELLQGIPVENFGPGVPLQ